MPIATPQELKKLLLSSGLEVYRTLPDRVVLADRVRDNLIMDSGVSVLTLESGLGIRVIFRAQGCDFQGESPESLFEHARRLGEPATTGGYAEVTTCVVPIHDPGDKSRVLDTWYEVTFELAIPTDIELLDPLRDALRWPKVATRAGT